MRILFVAAEVAPFARVGGLAEVTAALPKALVALGHDVRIVMPRYGGVDPSDLRVRRDAMPVPAGLGDHPARVLEGAIEGVPVYFIDNDYYFGSRARVYGESIEAFQFAYFARAVAELIIQSEWQPEVVHAHDWQTGLVPVLIRDTLRDHPAFRGMAVVFTLHNMSYQGVFPVELLDFARIDRRVFTLEGLEYFGEVNFLKGGIVYADLLNTVSPRYAEAIQTPTFGDGLDGVLRSRRASLRGILNGLDYEEYNPATDPALKAPYSLSNRAGKAACKAALQRELGLAEDPSVMLVAVLARMVDRNGFDLLAESAAIWSRMGLQVGLAGTGSKRYETMFARLIEQSPNVGGRIGFDSGLARRMFSGADAWLMPARFEPDGRDQLIAMRYGAVPIVHATGGLADTVSEFNPLTGTGTGFTFERYDTEAMLAAMRHARHHFGQPDRWRRLVINGMASDFSWTRSAERYLDYYQAARERRSMVGV